MVLHCHAAVEKAVSVTVKRQAIVPQSCSEHWGKPDRVCQKAHGLYSRAEAGLHGGRRRAWAASARRCGAGECASRGHGKARQAIGLAPLYSQTTGSFLVCSCFVPVSDQGYTWCGPGVSMHSSDALRLWSWLLASSSLLLSSALTLALGEVRYSSVCRRIKVLYFSVFTISTKQFSFCFSRERRPR